jgi:hypothetical protein
LTATVAGEDAGATGATGQTGTAVAPAAAPASCAGVSPACHALAETDAGLVTMARSLPGMPALADGLAEECRAARGAGAEAVLRGLEIARQIVRYSEQPEVLAAVAALESHRREAPGYKGGRPYEPLALTHLTVSTQSGVPDRTIKLWIMRYKQIAECQGWTNHEHALKEVLGNVAQNPSTLADWLDSALSTARENNPSERQLPFNPQTFLKKLNHVVQPYLFDVGTGRPKANSAARKIFLAWLKDRAEELGYAVVARQHGER